MNQKTIEIPKETTSAHPEATGKGTVTLNTSSAPTPADMLMRAVEGGADIDKIEKFMDLQERWEANQARKAFYDAFNSFQAEKPEIKKTKKVMNRDGRTVRYSFAPLPEMQHKVDPVLSKFGLSYNWEQKSVSTDKGVVLEITFVLRHVDGHSEKTTLQSSPDDSGGKNSIQSIGSSVSYLKRYTFSNGLGVSSDDDDDGQASEPTKEEVREAQKNQLRILMQEVSVHLEDKILKRVQSIIDKDEYTAYTKAIRQLTDIKNEHSKEQK